MSSPEFTPRPSDLQPKSPEISEQDDFIALAHDWQRRLDGAPMNNDFFKLGLEALNELNQRWSHYGRDLLFVGPLIRPEFDEDDEETGELISDDEDERKMSALEATSRGINILDMEDGSKPRLVYDADFRTRVQDESFKEVSITYRLKAPVTKTQFFVIDSAPRGELKERSDVNDAARVRHDELLRMVSDKAFYKCSAEVQRRVIEPFLQATNELLYDPNVPLYAICETTKFFMRESIESPYGYKSFKFPVPITLEGWHQGFGWLERDVIQDHAITSARKMIDPRAGLCAIILPTEVGGREVQEDQAIFVPLTYATEFHTMFEDSDSWQEDTDENEQDAA